MIKRLLTIHRSALVSMWTMFFLLSLSSAYAQTYEINVGDTQYVPSPSVSGYRNAYITAIYDFQNSNPDCLGYSPDSNYGVTIKVNRYYSGTSYVSYNYSFSYTGTDNKTHIGHGSTTIYVKCKPTEVKLSKTTLVLELGDEVDLSYTTNPSGLEPEVEWSTNDKSVASLSTKDGAYYDEQKIKNEKKVLVYAKKVGTCVIKLGCNTGYAAPTCSITVKDDRPHLMADVASGSVKKGTKVTLTCDRAGADIRYTTDKSEPTKSSQKYTSPIEIKESMTIKAKAYVNGEESKVLTLNYTVEAHMPGEVFTSKSVEGVDITYKVVADGTSAILQVGEGEDKRPAISKSYTGKITIPTFVDNMYVMYIGKHAFYECNISDVFFSNMLSLTVCGNAFYSCKKLKSMESSHYSQLKLESFAFNNCEALNTVIFFSTIVQPSNHDYAFWCCDNIKTIYSYEQPNTIGDDAFDSKVYEEATLYVKSEYLNQYKNYRGGGWKKFKNIKAIGDETNKKLTLTASPSGGEVSKGTVVYLTASFDGSTVSGCDIYYTLNGDKPTKSSLPYTSSGITINSNCTLKAIAYKSGYEDSEVLTTTYTIPTPKKLTLSASPSGGQVSAGTKVTLTAKADGSTVYGCDIYYTLNGNTPSRYSGTLYTSSGITINSGCTLKAIAYKSGYEDSEVLTTTYTIPTPKKLTLSASPNGGEVSANTTVTLTAKSEGSIVSDCDIYYTLNGDKPSTSSTKYNSSGITINSDCTLKAIAYKSGYEDSEVGEWEYTIKEIAPISIDVYPSSKTIKVGDTFTASYTLTPSNATTTVTWYSDNSSIASVSSSGLVTGKSVGYTYINAKTANGKEDWCKVTVESTPKPKLVLSASPSGGQVSSGTKVTLTVKADGSIVYGCDIYYTLNGTTPTRNSTPYTSSGITINSGCTLKAIAYKSGYKDSEVLTETYTSDGIVIDATNFPDEYFRNYLLSRSYGQDGILTNNEISSITEINVSNKRIKSLKGIDFFTALGTLRCYDNQLTSLDVSKCVVLKTLRCYDNQLTNLDVSKNTALTGLFCYNNQLTALDVSKNTALTDLFCEHNQLTALDASKNTKLTTLNCYNNQLTSLDVSKNTSLTTLNCYNNQLTSLDMSKNTSLTTLNCYNNQLTSLDVSKNTRLTTLNCSSNQITSVKVSENNTVLRTLDCFRNCISGTNMDNLINSLPKKESSAKWYVIDNSENDEGNVCTKQQVVAAKDKGWTPYYKMDGNWYEYEGYYEQLKNYDIVLSSSDYATFYSSESAYTLPSGLSASVVTSASTNKLAYRTFADNVVPKGVPVMIESDTKQAGAYTLTAVESGTTYTGTNLLRGSDEATTTTGDGYHYKLSYGPTGTKWDDVFGWYWGAQNGAPFQIEGHKAWLVVPKNGTRAAGFNIEGESLGIENIDHSPLTTDFYYDLQGRRITDKQNVRPSKKGVYIRNGQKVVVK